MVQPAISRLITSLHWQMAEPTISAIFKPCVDRVTRAKAINLIRDFSDVSRQQREAMTSIELTLDKRKVG